MHFNYLLFLLRLYPMCAFYTFLISRPDNLEELLETTVGMMINNDISLEMKIVFNSVPF